MIKFFIILIFCSLTLQGVSQKPLKELIPIKGKTIQSFVPNGWLRLHTVFGDYNSDGIKDAAIVIIDSIEEKIIGDANRSLVILKGTESGFIVSGYCDSAVMCYGCGGVHGDPYENMTFRNNKLVVFHYGGSMRRWSIQHTFQFRDENWVVIGMTIRSWWLMINNTWRINDKATYSKSINYLTGEYFEKEIGDSGELMLNKNEKQTVKPLLALEDFRI